MPYIKLRVKRWERDGKEYTSYQVTAPKGLIEELGWRQGDILYAYIKNGELVYRRRYSPKGGKQTRLKPTRLG
ncbi:MAG: AbrB/MazE/SpoVT family DNA-binding domain-containing protein [Candidatus Korarchaeota archaeon]|nr:AbrB/MazE/SpoVT family DNA-binding domain-containing protein [Candidatus Korarchaeota archaeon]